MKPRKKAGGRAKNREVRLRARAVSRGVAIGTAICLYGRARQFYRRSITTAQIGNEQHRFDAAVELARVQLDQLAKRSKKDGARSAPGIFDAHLMILDEGSLCEKIKTGIGRDLVNAEWATKIVIDEYVRKYKSLEDETLRERYIDLEDVGERLQSALGGSAEPNSDFARHAIIVSAELRPSTLVELAESQPAGLVTESGGWTSHTFIISRELSLPAVTGVQNVLKQVHDGDTVIVDGYIGEVIIDPTEETLQRYRERPGVRPNDSAAVQPDGVAKTLDGISVVLRANADSPAVYQRAHELGANGVGLYRSEYLFSRSKGYPSIPTQVAAYSAIADAAGAEGVKIRTFDINHSDSVGDALRYERNPALGLRAIRLGLTDRTQLRGQIRALLVASHERKIDIILPMVSGAAEIHAVSDLIRREKRSLRAKKISYGEPRLGAMIEVPSAVMTIDQIVNVVDFIALGTNDLVQYMLAVDRDNETVAEWFASLHPAVLRAVESTLAAAAAAGKEAIVCGEMAGSPFYVPVLIGLGARQLSMNVNSLASVRRLISGIAFEEARSITSKCLDCDTPAEVEKVLISGIREKWAPLFPEHFDLSPRHSGAVG